MTTVRVNPPQTINIKVNQGGQKTIQGSTTFVGAADVQSQVNQIQQAANVAQSTAETALHLAQGAYDTANTKYDKTGGHVYGNVIVDNNLTVSNTIFADTETIDAGIF